MFGTLLQFLSRSLIVFGFLLKIVSRAFCLLWLMMHILAYGGMGEKVHWKSWSLFVYSFFDDVYVYPGYEKQVKEQINESPARVVEGAGRSDTLRLVISLPGIELLKQGSPPTFRLFQIKGLVIRVPAHELVSLQAALKGLLAPPLDECQEVLWLRLYGGRWVAAPECFFRSLKRELDETIQSRNMYQAEVNPAQTNESSE